MTIGRRAGGAASAALLSSGTATAAAFALAWAAPSPNDAVALLIDVGISSDAPTGAEAGIVALVSLAAWACIAWTYLAALLTAASWLPGRLGRLSAAAARRLIPAALRRLVEVALGVSIATGSVAAGAALPAAAAPIVTAAAATTPIVTAAAATTPIVTAAAAGPTPFVWPELDWPGLVEAATIPASVPALPSRSATDASAPGSSTAPATPSTAAVPADPTSVAPQVPAPIVAPAPRGDGAAPATAPSPANSAPPAASSSAAAGPRLLGAPNRAPAAAAPVVVHRADTLWAIAARQLGTRATPAAIAAEWPRWYAANRDVIGADPDLLLPGQRLTAPPPG